MKECWVWSTKNPGPGWRPAQKTLSHWDRVGHLEAAGPRVKHKFAEGQGSSSDGQGGWWDFGAGILQPWVGGNWSSASGGASRGVQRLLQRGMGEGAQPSRSPYYLRVEARWEPILSWGHPRSFNGVPSSHCPCFPPLPLGAAFHHLGLSSSSWSLWRA